MATLKRSLIVAALLLLCVASAHAQRPSPADCDAYARNVASRSQGVVGGAISGGVGGAVFGAIVGEGGKGAKRGAALGALLGGISQGARRDKARRRAYDDCMAGRVRW